MFFSLAVFLGAALLFLVEPIFARMVLPKLGGAPAVWNTCVAAYQSLLLAAYAYAHVISTRLSVRRQIALHLTFGLAAALVLPVQLDPAWIPQPSANPSGAVLRLLLVSVGPPFFVLAASGPLLQHWFLRRHSAARNPYSLYAASNVGSLLGLLAYPLAVEPLLRLRDQSLLWTAAYGGFLLIAGYCGVATWHAPSNAMSPSHRGVDAPDSTNRWPARLQWLGLAFMPSSLLLSVTTFISTDLAAVPLLWVVPMALYLVTLVVAFADRQVVSRVVMDRVLPAASVGIVALILADSAVPVRYSIVAHVSGFVVMALACHMRLAAQRPDATRLTEFYLWLAAGGALGGIFNTFIAPWVFVSPLEYPLAVVGTCFFFPASLPWPRDLKAWARAVAATALPALLFVVLTVAVRRFDWSLLEESTKFRYAVIGGPVLILAHALRRTPARFGIALMLVLAAGSWLQVEKKVTLHAERNFFGVHRVTDDGVERVLTSGTTMHGSQAVDPTLECEPLTYYSRTGPIGQVLAHVKARLPNVRAGVVGLGTASLAAYAGAGDSWTFFEIDPAVERLARNPAYFTYLRDCAPDARIVLGDARLSLEREPDASFDVLVLDAFSSDAIPVHLMTVDAVALYFRKLAPEGLLAFHISNRFLDLAPVVIAVAEAQGLSAVLQEHTPDVEDIRIPQAARTTWMVVARRPSDLQSLIATRLWDGKVSQSGPLWTDDYSNVVGVLFSLRD